VTAFPETAFGAWTQLGLASFSKRYFGALWRFARLELRVGTARAQDLAQAFLLRELQREAPVFLRFEEGAVHGAKFRTYLRTCFFRFARDELRKERLRSGRPLHDLPPRAIESGAAAFDRVVVRDLLADLRARIAAGLDVDGRRYLDLKWPLAFEQGTRPDTEIAADLRLTRARLRTIKRKVAARILLAVRNQIHDEGLRGSEADDVLSDYLSILGERT